MHTQTMVRAAVLTNYMEVAAELGLNPVAELRQVGLTAKMLVGPDTPIPFSAAVQLLEQSAKRSGYDNLGLRMAERRRLSDFGVASLLLPHQQTPRDAILMTNQYRHLLNESLVLAIEEKPKTSVIREEVLTDTPMLATQVTELAVAMILLTFRAMIGGHWRPQGTHFTHAAPKDLEVHKRLFKCPLHFNSDFSGISCLTSDLYKENPLANPTMANYARAFIDALPRKTEDSVVSEIRRVIYLFLPMRRATIKQVAQALGCSVRSLQRELDASGQSFTDLLNTVRSELAMRYLADTGTEIGQIASLLGYARSPAFIRWFAQHFGSTPQRWRQLGSDAEVRSR
jgi:AraC-like DNA-binding protein